MLEVALGVARLALVTAPTLWLRGVGNLDALLSLDIFRHRFRIIVILEDVALFLVVVSRQFAHSHSILVCNILFVFHPPIELLQSPAGHHPMKGLQSDTHK